MRRPTTPPPPSRMAAGPSTVLLMGRIGAAHGTRGEVRLTTFTGRPEDIAAYGPLATDRPGLTLTIAALRLKTDHVIARFTGVDDRTAAERLNGVSLFVHRSRLPPPEDEDDFYHADLLGLVARLPDGTALGEVTAVPNFGAGDLIEVRDPQTGDTFLFPFSRAVVPDIRPDEGWLTIVPPTDADPGDEDPD